MTSVDITNIDAALGKVRAFIALLDMNHAEWEQTGGAYSQPSSLLKSSNAQIQEQLPVITRIAARADANLAAKMEPHYSAYGWSYNAVKVASQQLAGLLSSVEEIERILGPRGPKLSATNLHPWIWNAAVSLWDDGYRREAVQAGATALFDQHLPAKLGVPPAKSSKDLPAQAFSIDPPAPGKPRLRLDDHQDGSPSWISQHDGAKALGMGCAQLIRNLATHVGAQPDEQIALEQLATLSMLARLIERAKVVH